MQVTDMTGLLFPNKDRKSDNHPNLKGMIMVEGIEYWASGWVKRDKSGGKYISIALTPKREKANSSVQQKLEDEDDIPF